MTKERNARTNANQDRKAIPEWDVVNARQKKGLFGLADGPPLAEKRLDEEFHLIEVLEPGPGKGEGVQAWQVYPEA